MMNSHLKKLILTFICALCLGTAQAITMQVCFTPGADCQGMIAKEIVNAHHSVYVQAYHLTNKAIINALYKARKNGAIVTIVVDKQAKQEALRLIEQGFSVSIDYKPRIAHNKVMIIDDKTVITGSFNFTAAAQKSNAENVIIIEDSKIAGLYEDNFFKREHLSRRVEE